MSEADGSSPITGDVMMMELSTEMDLLRLPSETNTLGSSATAVTEATAPIYSNRTQHQQRRPYDDVVDAGPPADPVPFAQPNYGRGSRSTVLCYYPETGQHEQLENVLYRDTFPPSNVTKAYWPYPYKQLIKTIMGHVEICVVLKRTGNSSDNSSSSNNSSDSDDSYEADDEDVVFETTDELVAVKVNYTKRMEELRGKHSEDPLKEIAAMQLIGNTHPNVLGIIDVIYANDDLNIVLPYCANGDLFQLLLDSSRTVDGQETKGMSEIEARFWFRQIVIGIQYLHNIGISHRDLSPENVMINNNNSLIIDMGMCLKMPYTDARQVNKYTATDINNGTNRRLIKPQGACGKLPYMSPEVFLNREPFDGSAIDVWTAGTILFCMVTGDPSYGQPHLSDLKFYWMTNGLDQLLQDWRVDISDDGYHLLHNMLQIDPRARLSIDEVVNHPWFNQENAIPSNTIQPGIHR